MPARFYTVFFAYFVFVSAAPAQSQAAAGRAATVAILSSQLRWHDESGRQRYAAARDGLTRQILGEVDGFISDSFDPASATADQVRSGLDTLLGQKQGAGLKNFAFLVDLPIGKCLIAGVELSRGGEAIAENAVSIRAYTAVGDKFVLAADASDLRSSDPDSLFLQDLHAAVLPTPPATGGFWFIALAEVPPQAPPTVAMHVYAFDGEKLRTMWAPKDILAETVDSAVQVTNDGFLVQRLVDKSGIAAHSPETVFHERYLLSAQGVQKLNAWETGR